ncbi:pirin family protein [Lyngbya confervoides]|uniref:Pirin family protein n=1 Tax=Lyngbya confervoides BDU141951 TaxID=1574623 RepID=A0ABD4T2H6_9CYAN|nr:pirin family protein [Lyngbya confervoides]MCM1982805.1 pirin family protein [Lyngbya confervoides BDU141951]
MFRIRRSQDRGMTHFHWLESHHTFSFGHYFDPQFMGFGPLRVINEDRVLPGEGFATHSHQNMEIITYVLSGQLEHRDSLGNGSVMVPGEVQRMSAGTGISHSEYNPSPTEGVHLLQIWIVPDRQGLPPSYEQRHFDIQQQPGTLHLVGSPDGRGGSLTIHQNVHLYAGRLRAQQSVVHQPAGDRQIWIQVTQGSVQIPGAHLEAGDGVALIPTEAITLQSQSDESEVLLFDLAGSAA